MKDFHLFTYVGSFYMIKFYSGRGLLSSFTLVKYIKRNSIIYVSVHCKILVCCLDIAFTKAIDARKFFSNL